MIPKPQVKAPAPEFAVKQWLGPEEGCPCGTTRDGKPRFARQAVVLDAKGAEHTVEVLCTSPNGLNGNAVQVLGHDTAQFWAVNAPRGAVPEGFAL